MKQTESTHHMWQDYGSLTNSYVERTFIQGESPS